MLAHAFLSAICAQDQARPSPVAPEAQFPRKPDLCFHSPFPKSVTCSDNCSGITPTMCSWGWPGRGGDDATAVVLAITTPNVASRQGNLSVAIIAPSSTALLVSVSGFHSSQVAGLLLLHRLPKSSFCQLACRANRIQTNKAVLAW